MGRILTALLALALSMVLTTPAFACRDARDGKPWRPKEAGPGTVVQNIDVATGSKVFEIGTATVDRVHYCVQIASSDLTNQGSIMGLYLWAASNQDFYRIWVTNGTLGVAHHLFGQDFDLVPRMDFDAPKKGGDRMIEFDVKANKTGADVEVDGQPVVNIIARPPADARRYGVIFTAAPGKPSTFRLGPVLRFGDGG